MLAEFELLTPRSLPEALQMLADGAPVPVAGGTNLIVDMRSGRHCPPALMDISHLRELRGVRRDDGEMIMGGGTTIGDVLSDPLIAGCSPVLREAAAVFANPLVRNRATVGGNLVDASPAADMAPALLALDANVELAGQHGTRCLPLEDFFVGVRKTQLHPDELLVAVRWPVPASHSAAHFHKLGLRKADAISVLSAAVMVTGEAGPDAGPASVPVCRAAHIALGAVAARPIRAHAAEAALSGHPLTAEAIAEAGLLAAEAASPISDVRGSAAYRRHVIRVVVGRLLSQVVEDVAREMAGGRGADPCKPK